MSSPDHKAKFYEPGAVIALQEFYLALLNSMAGNDQAFADHLTNNFAINFDARLIHGAEDTAL